MGLTTSGAPLQGHTQATLVAQNATNNGATATVGASATGSTTTPWTQWPTIRTQSGEASFYGEGDGFAGGTTATGLHFDPMAFTFASNSLPAGTLARISTDRNKDGVPDINPENGKPYTITAVVTDTGGFSSAEYNHRIADLSVGAAKALGVRTAPGSGTANVMIEVIDQGPGRPVVEQNVSAWNRAIQNHKAAVNRGAGITEALEVLRRL